MPDGVVGVLSGWWQYASALTGEGETYGCFPIGVQ